MSDDRRAGPGMRRAMLALEDGTVFEGTAFGAPGERSGEVVFNTSMMGYQEILTDPSYKGQIVTMTYPLIGNYGVNAEDVESERPHVEGFVVREYSRRPSNWRSEGSLGDYLTRYGIIGIEGIDTRALTKHLRTYGAKKGVISTEDLDADGLVQKAVESPGLIGRDLVKEVTTPQRYAWSGWETVTTARHSHAADGSQLSLEIEAGEPEAAGRVPRRRRQAGGLGDTLKVVALDYGVKHNIFRELTKRRCEVLVLPANCTAEDVLGYGPDGVFLSNGPGDPEGVPYAIETVRRLIGKVPIFGICLGHQILGLAYGGQTYKLKFGHRGGNQPVKNLDTGIIEITAQNHGFAVDMESLKDQPVRLTHINLNDDTNEGMEHEETPVFSVQYHPEASPGPHDARYLFDKFVEMMREA
ncbi:MAG: glutamine-hydrolyzing carbamoyl-phosphate synthase small subunit [Armatimonadota bacterium]